MCPRVYLIQVQEALAVFGHLINTALPLFLEVGVLVEQGIGQGLHRKALFHDSSEAPCIGGHRAHDGVALAPRR